MDGLTLTSVDRQAPIVIAQLNDHDHALMVDVIQSCIQLKEDSRVWT